MVQYEYDAWGNVQMKGNTNIGNLNPFRYRSYYFDTETGFYFLKTRYYDPEVGRFINIDSIKYVDPETINGLNLFAYCGNNPVMNIDPTGKLFWIGAIIGGIFGAAVGALTAYIKGDDVLAGALIGAVEGAIIGSGVGGVAGAFLAGAIASGANDVANGREINFVDAAISGATAGLFAGISKAMTSLVEPVLVNNAEEAIVSYLTNVYTEPFHLITDTIISSKTGNVTKEINHKILDFLRMLLVGGIDIIYAS